MRPALSALGALLACSCTVPRGAVTAERAAALKPGEGLAAATFEFKGMDRSGREVAASRQVSVIGEGLEENRSVDLTITPHLADGKSAAWLSYGGLGGEPSDVVAVPLPEGKYEITGWMIQDHAVTAGVTFRNRLPMKVPFEVKAGETTYLGRMNSVSIYGKNMIGLPVPGEGFVFVTDHHQEDIPRICKTYPSVKRSSVRRSDVPRVYRDEVRRIVGTPPRFFGLF